MRSVGDECEGEECKVRSVRVRSVGDECEGKDV